MTVWPTRSAYSCRLPAARADYPKARPRRSRRLQRAADQASTAEAGPSTIDTTSSGNALFETKRLHPHPHHLIAERNEANAPPRRGCPYDLLLPLGLPAWLIKAKHHRTQHSKSSIHAKRWSSETRIMGQILSSMRKIMTTCHIAVLVPFQVAFRSRAAHNSYRRDE